MRKRGELIVRAVKLISVLTAVTLVCFSLCACGGKDNVFVTGGEMKYADTDSGYKATLDLEIYNGDGDTRTVYVAVAFYDNGGNKTCVTALKPLTLAPGESVKEKILSDFSAFNRRSVSDKCYRYVIEQRVK